MITALFSGYKATFQNKVRNYGLHTGTLLPHAWPQGLSLTAEEISIAPLLLYTFMTLKPEPQRPMLPSSVACLG